MKAKYVRNKEKDAAYYMANKERIAAYYRERGPAYREENKERIAASKAAYWVTNKDKIKNYNAKYAAANREKITARKKEYHAANKEKSLSYYAANKERIAKYRKENKDRIAATNAEYRAANKSRKNECTMKRYYADSQFRVAMILRARVSNLLKRKGVQKTFQSHIRLLGCSVDKACAHIEAQFEPWMSWENYGRFGWHIDHIKPLTAFDLSDPAQVAKACHYTNLQPLHWRKNIIKGASI